MTTLSLCASLMSLGVSLGMGLLCVMLIVHGRTPSLPSAPRATHPRPTERVAPTGAVRLTDTTTQVGGTN
jgi:hypothetical protein